MGRRSYKNKLSGWENFLLRIGLASKWVRLQEGRIVYRKLEKDLPSAQGNCETDKDRLILFSKSARLLRSFEQKCLKEWLKHELSLSNITFMMGTMSAREEERANRWTNILSEHLEALDEENV